MKHKISQLIVAILLIAFATHYTFAQTIPADTAVRIGKLANGLTYYIRHNTIPKGQADFHLVQKVGSMQEEENQRGLAHFLEHMAFNGTKHFPGNTMISELEKKGIKFGSNMNAYTGYDETVYRLTNIPVNREGILDTALLVLHDWSGFILNNDKDIDEERGVIREEWRTRSSGYLRVQESGILPKLFEGTLYARRLPIGTTEIVENFKYKELKDYYKKWYRPDLQGIVIVGDVVPEQVEAKLKQLFAGIPAPVNPAQREYVKLPENKQPIVAIASDPEIRNTSATVYWKQDPITAILKSNIQYFKIAIINNIISNMFNERFDVLAKKNNNAWQISAGMTGFSVASSVPAWSLNINAPKNDLTEAMKVALLECERIRRFGFSKNEFEPIIKNANLAINESNYYDRNNRQNFIFTHEYKSQFLNGSISPPSEWKYKMTKDILEGLNIDTLNFYAKKYISDQNMAFEILYPIKAGLPLPSKSDIVQLWDEAKKREIKPWIKEEKQNDLTNLKTPLVGKAIKTETNSPPFGYTKWLLSNGVNVWFKKTGYEESNVQIYGYKPGGYSQVNLTDLPSALAYNQLGTVASGFVGTEETSVYSFLNQYESAISAIGTIMNLKMLFQDIYLRMTIYKKEQPVFDNWRTKRLQQISSRAANPKVVFGDTLTAIMSNHHPRALSLIDPKVLNQVTYEKVMKLHKRYFGNANGFTFVITGNLNIDSVKVLAETWLGGLPAIKKSDTTIVDHGMKPPKGIIEKHFIRKMQTPQTTITIGYTGEIPYTVDNNILIAFCAEVLKMKYTEMIREKEGASYGVGVSAQLTRQPKGHFMFQVNFDTAPDPVKKAKLISIVYQEINKLIVDGPEEEKVDKIRNNKLKNYFEDSNSKNSGYWGGNAGALLLYGIDLLTNYDKRLLSVTPSKIQEFAKRIFTQGNKIEVVMDPK